MNLQYVGLVLVLSVASVILHELAHGVVAYWLGDQTAKISGRLTLNPLKHIDPFMSILLPVILAFAGMPVFGGAKPVPINTRNLKGGVWGFALVAIAGPLTNLFLAFCFFLFGHFTGVFYVDGFWGLFCTVGMLLNLGFCLFNLIPVPPLDGSRVLYALAPDGARAVMEQIERYGIIIIYMLILFCGTLFTKYMAGGQTAIIQAFYWLVGVR